MPGEISSFLEAGGWLISSIFFQHASRSFHFWNDILKVSLSRSRAQDNKTGEHAERNAWTYRITGLGKENGGM